MRKTIIPFKGIVIIQFNRVVFITLFLLVSATSGDFIIRFKCYVRHVAKETKIEFYKKKCHVLYDCPEFILALTHNQARVILWASLTVPLESIISKLIQAPP